jgi:hypothetical protein
MGESWTTRQLHLKRIIDWCRVHRVNLEVDSPSFKCYQTTYKQLPSAPYAGKKYPYLVVSTGHAGSVWIAFLCQLLDPDNMLCFHAHETVRAWVKFDDQLNEPSKWSAWTAELRAARRTKTPAQLLDWLCPQLPSHLSTNLQAFNVVGYSLTADSGPWLGVIDAAASLRSDTKLTLLVRDGVLVVNSYFLFHSALMSENPMDAKDSNINSQILRETIRAHGIFKSPTFKRHLEDVFLAREADVYDRWATRYPEHEMFVGICYMWRMCNACLIETLDKADVDKRILIRLEDVTTNRDAVAAFRRFLLGVGAEHPLFDAATALAQSLVVNRKVHDNVDSRRVWRSWTAAQRTIFADICGPIQSHYSYEIP